MPTDHPITSEIRYVEIKPGYRVGFDGSVWSSWKKGWPPHIGHTWKQMKPTPQYRGHMAIWLGRNDQRFVHRLVLEAFVGPCPEGMECRHLNGDPSNNALDNLCWGTRVENHQDSVKHGTAYFKPGMDSPGRVLNEGEIKAIFRFCNTGMTQARASEIFGVHETTVNAIMTGRVWTEFTGLTYTPQSNGRKGQKRAKITDEQVAMIRQRVIPGKRTGEAARIAKELGVSHRAVMLIAHGKRRLEAS